MLNGFWSEAGCWLGQLSTGVSFLLDSDDCDLLLDGIDFSRSRSDCYVYGVSRSSPWLRIEMVWSLWLVRRKDASAQKRGCEYEREKKPGIMNYIRAREARS